MHYFFQIRPLFAGIAALTIIAMLFAVLYLQQQLGLPPCPLCITQRAFVVLCGVSALIAFLHNPQGWGRRVYATICVLAAIGGGAVAARHIWLQNLPEDLVPACGPGLSYMLETFPLSETFQLIMMGDGNCADISWTFLGLTIPEQTLIVFIVLAVLSVFQLVRPKER
ncbi:MAG: disulfide bond formation protein B [Congregibacter sp.]